MTEEMPTWTHIYVLSPVSFCVDENDPDFAYVLNSNGDLYFISSLAGGSASLVLTTAGAAVIAGACDEAWPRNTWLSGPWVDKSNGDVYISVSGQTGLTGGDCKNYVLRSARGGGGFAKVGLGTFIYKGITGNVAAYNGKAWVGGTIVVTGPGGILLNDNGQTYADGTKQKWPAALTHYKWGTTSHYTYPDGHDENYCWACGDGIHGTQGLMSTLHRVWKPGPSGDDIDLSYEAKEVGQRLLHLASLRNFWGDPSTPGSARVFDPVFGSTDIVLRSTNYFNSITQSDYIIDEASDKFKLEVMCQMRWSKSYEWGAAASYFNYNRPCVYGWSSLNIAKPRAGDNWNISPYEDSIPENSQIVAHFGFWAGVAEEEVD